MASEHLQELCTNSPSIASALAKDPSKSIDKVIKSLIKDWKEGASKKARKDDGKVDETERMNQAAACGLFPDRPSDLFLKVCIAHKLVTSSSQ